MMLSRHSLSVLLLLGSIVACYSSKDDKCFRASSVDHIVIGSEQKIDVNDPLKNIRKNLQAFNESAERASDEGAQIIVFPEYGLSPPNNATDPSLTQRQSVRLFSEDIPNPKDAPVNPCTQAEFKDRPILQSLSCIAHTNNIYLVACMSDVKKCKTANCTEDGYLMYNTQVAFDRNGFLVGRYHKFHLYNEFWYDVPEREFAYFDTDFGARVGMYVCFDRLFHDPTIALVEDYNVTTMALSTWFFELYPFLLSHQVDQSWSIGLGINIVSSNIKHLSTGSTGSGVFSPKHITYTHDASTSGRPGYSTLVVATVPVDPKSDHNCDPDPWKLKLSKYRQKPGQKYASKYGDFEDLVTREMVEPEGNSEQVCDDDLCCNFNYKVKQPKPDGEKVYYLGAKSRKIQYDNGTGSYHHEQACFIIAFNMSTGQYERKATHAFKELEVSGNFSTKYQYPGAVATDLKLIDNDEIIFTKNRLVIDSRKPLIYAGIYARIYDVE